MENKLTSEIVRKAVEELNKNLPMEIKFHENKMLSDNTVLLCGKNVYYSPLIESGQVKIITIPEFETPTFNVDVNY